MRKKQSASAKFQNLRDELQSKGFSRESGNARKWFRDRLRGLNSSRILSDGSFKKTDSPEIGHMYMYAYDPKMKKQLPFYDKFPLSIVVQPTSQGGFHGLNLHYLRPATRAVFLDKLMESFNMTDEKGLQLRYQMLKGAARLKEFEPCFKHYLAGHIRSPLVKVEPRDWTMAIFLPTEQFVGGTNRSIWKQSL